MPGEIRTRRWNDPAEPGDGTALLCCRYRPRGVAKADETWTEWCRALAPSPGLLAAFYGKGRAPIDFAEYRRRYLAELAGPLERLHLQALVDRVARGETLTLLCSSACVDPARCHRTILRECILGLVARAERSARPV